MTDYIYTQWFGPDEKPVHVGVYPASRSRDPDLFRYWNGKRFSFGFYESESEEEKRAVMGFESPLKDIYWRGLAENPNAVEITDKQMLDWLEADSNIENFCGDDDGDTVRMIMRFSGSRNDRECEEIGRGATLREAIIAAMKSEGE